MLSHAAIWDGIDTMARRHGLSVSALARLAGLDSTTFNLSKRRGKDGRERWPSTESIAKILEATGDTFESFLAGTGAYMQPPNPLDMPIPTPRSVPLLGFAQAGAGGFFDSAGFPAGQGWDEVRLPTAGEDGTYALEVTGDSMLPLYRDGDVILVSPTAQLRRGDRVAPADPKAHRTAFPQSRTSQQGVPNQRDRVGGAHRLGQPIAFRPCPRLLPRITP
jgi:phage repressor protein C with HTH and peptisase S24 domain